MKGNLKLKLSFGEYFKIYFPNKWIYSTINLEKSNGQQISF